jgi:hypothetical protein
MTFRYFVTDPSGREHCVTGQMAYDALIDSLRQKHGELSELLIRAELLGVGEGGQWTKDETSLAA